MLVRMRGYVIGSCVGHVFGELVDSVYPDEIAEIEDGYAQALIARGVAEKYTDTEIEYGDDDGQ